MTLFKYTALDPGGKKLSGVIDADSLEGAKQKLRNQRMFVTNVVLSRAKAPLALDQSTLITFTRELAQLLRSGLPLYESLLTIEEKYRSHKCHVIFLDLCDQVKQGRALSEAFTLYSKTFDPMYIAMVAAGEKTGDLEGTFFQLYKVLSRSEKFRKQIRGAMVYPVFLSSFCSLVVLGLFLFLIPSMRELLEGRRLNPMTQTVLRISNWLTSNGVWFFPTLISLILLIVLVLRIPRVKNRIKIFLLKVPILRSLLTEAILMRFSRALSVLLSGGIPIVDALRLSRRIIQHPSFEEVVQEAEEGLVQGRKLSEMLKASPLIPPLVIRMLSTAEETGSTPEMLINVAEIYEEALEKSLTQFTNLLQPVMLLVLGILVGVVLLSVLLPLTDVSSLV